MTLKIDFYLAKQPDFQLCQALCYQLVTAVYEKGHDIIILFNELKIALALHHTLWNHDACSFIPHTIDQNKNTIKISRPGNPHAQTQCQMHTTPINWHPNTQHIIQIVPNNESDKHQARLLYKHYTQLGHSITVHKDA